MKPSTFSLVCSLAGLSSALYVPVTVERRDSKLPSFTLPSDVGIPFTSGQNSLATTTSNQPTIQNDHDLLVSVTPNCFISQHALISGWHLQYQTQINIGGQGQLKLAALSR